MRPLLGIGLVIGLVVGLAACRSKGASERSTGAPGGAPGGAAPGSTSSMTQPSPLQELNARTSDPNATRAERCNAVFELFDKTVTPGMTGAALAQVFTDRTWLADSVDERVTVVGGFIPVEITANDSVFVIRCLALPRPDLDGLKWSGWVVYGRISGQTAQTFGALLAAGTSVKLVEFALSYPEGRIEKYAPAGRTTMHTPP